MFQLIILRAELVFLLKYPKINVYSVSKLLLLHNPLADLHGHGQTNHHNYNQSNRYLLSGKGIQKLQTFPKTLLIYII